MENFPWIHKTHLPRHPRGLFIATEPSLGPGPTSTKFFANGGAIYLPETWLLGDFRVLALH